MTTHETALAQRLPSGLPQPAPVPKTQAWALPYEPASVAAARKLVRECLIRWGLGGLVDDGVVVVSELVTNAVKTGCRRHMELAVDLISGGAVRISVRDGSRALPALIRAEDEAESGRGMALVHSLTGERWGVVQEGAGKAVWATIGSPSPVVPQVPEDRELTGASPGGEPPVRRTAVPSPPAAAWLASAAGPRAVQVNRRWRNKRLAPLPIGIAWDVVRMSAAAGIPLLKADKNGLGPVLHDRALSVMLWLVPPGLPDHWPPNVDLIRAGTLLCPPPHITDSALYARAWVHWPVETTPVPLTPAARLAAALRTQGALAVAGLAS